MQIAEASAAGDRFIEDGAARHFLDILAEVADGNLPRHGDGAFISRFLADDHAEERRLAGAVRPDQADLLARIELEGGVDEEDLLAVLLADVGEGDHESRVWHTDSGGPLSSTQSGGKPPHSTCGRQFAALAFPRDPRSM